MIRALSCKCHTSKRFWQARTLRPRLVGWREVRVGPWFRCSSRQPGARCVALAPRAESSLWRADPHPRCAQVEERIRFILRDKLGGKSPDSQNTFATPSAPAPEPRRSRRGCTRCLHPLTPRRPPQAAAENDVSCFGLEVRSFHHCPRAAGLSARAAEVLRQQSCGMAWRMGSGWRRSRCR